MKKNILILILMYSCQTIFGLHNIRCAKFYSKGKKFDKGITEITICEGEILQLTAEPVANATYEWVTPDNEVIYDIDLIRMNTTLLMSGKYSLEVRVNNCSDMSFINVNIIPKPNAGIDSTLELLEGLEPSEQELFEALEGTPELGGNWTKSENVYRYTVKSNNVCNFFSTATVVVKRSIKLINGFSPNDDGINDTWKVISDLEKRYPNNSLVVFSVNGNKVYKASPYKNDWNAVSNEELTINHNKKLPPGSYYYILELQDSNKNTLKGWLQINY
ncbi:gliding motility-associated C-terminal domain-containing protein [Tenacibaculum sp. C7A-26P2]|uniref:gliding motility-associated C-terminal domain-containing protein n=1 Tax=Tenacibaculum sp. C7A-26P2 TaxID=3447504 RepID=UPI003F82A2BE